MPTGFKKEFIAIIGVVVVLVVGIVGYIYVSGGSGEASEPISAPTLAVQPPTTTEEVAVTEEAPTQATEAPEVTEAAESAVIAPETTDTTNSLTLFRIDQTESQASFSIDEMLRGVPTTVLGVTNQVAGDVIVNFANPSQSELGMIRINARTLATDNDFRNRAIRGQILESAKDEYEFVEFTPTGLSGLAESAVTVGETLTFQVTGDLKIRDIVNSVTFDVTVNLATEDRITGNATTTVTREAYGLTIPSALGVADVSDDVILTIDFVALATDS